LRIRVYAVSGGSRDLLGTAFVPLASFLSKEDLSRAKTPLPIAPPTSLSSQPPPTSPTSGSPSSTNPGAAGSSTTTTGGSSTTGIDIVVPTGAPWEIQAALPSRNLPRLPLQPPPFYVYQEQKMEEEKSDDEDDDIGGDVLKPGDIDDDGNLVFEDLTKTAEERRALLAASRRPPPEVFVDLRPESLNSTSLRTEQNYWRTDKGDEKDDDIMTAQQASEEAELRARALAEGREVKERPQEILTIDCYRFVPQIPFPHPLMHFIILN
jgi:hypothetical protein